jgi:hypothetical protein
MLEGEFQTLAANIGLPSRIVFASRLVGVHLFEMIAVKAPSPSRDRVQEPLQFPVTLRRHERPLRTSLRIVAIGFVLLLNLEQEQMKYPHPALIRYGGPLSAIKIRCCSFA